MAQQAYLIFSLDDFLYALPAADIRHVIRSAAISPLSGAPDLVAGVLNAGGWFIPVIHIRRQLHLPPKPISVPDRIIIAGIGGYTIAFFVDAVEGVAALASKPLGPFDDGLPLDIDPSRLFPGMENCISGIAHINQRTVFIYDAGSLFPESALRAAADALHSAMVQRPV